MLGRNFKRGRRGGTIKGWLAAVVCVSFVFSCISCGSGFYGTNSRSVTGILGALEEEVSVLEKQLLDKREEEIRRMRFVSGKLRGREVVIAKTGIGKVNAAMVTTLLLERFRPSEIIFTGIAGGINPELLPGDVVIGERTAQHDLGMLSPDGLINRGEISPVTGERNPVFFEADERLLGLAERAAEEVGLGPIETREGKRVPKIIKGVIVTGDIFAASTAKSIELREKLRADAVEMEGAAVAQVCYEFGVPCIVIRSISDKAGEESLAELDEYLDVAAGNAAALTAELVECLGRQKGF
jgi:adenosylhomocysteine nucleosidase